ncbi:unnamed protein product [Cuscuta epithymum]|uniref:F-box domain-containing protein n=1 Tax=Cuscuta epithymum TaxID=186058 RepID=A0AAV0EP56_9ASTE|nr:unnamed protein product [Cuscuta epithymum]
MMATRRMDRFSQLPTEILESILGLLAIQEAARMAILSNFWRQMWFNIRDLKFDCNFFHYIERKYSSAHSDLMTKTTKSETINSDVLTSAGMHVVNKVLMQHNGHIRKFEFSFIHHGRSSLTSRAFEIDQWFLLVTQKGVEQLDIRFLVDKDEYSLPKCIFSCPTLKRLWIHGVSVEPLNMPCILPNATSLAFVNSKFEPNDALDYRVNVPMLERLLLIGCDNMFSFNITAPKLFDLKIHSCWYEQCSGFLPVHLDLGSVISLDLDALSLKKFVEDFPNSGPQLQPHELNVEYLYLSNPYNEDDASSAFIHLLKLCPKSHEIHMDMAFVEALRDCLDTKSENSKELYRVAETHNLLHTLSIDFFDACENYLPLVKGLLSSFPTLVKFVIKDLDSESSKQILELPTNVEMTVVNFEY